MEVKKSPKVDLENKKPMFMQIGVVFALAIVLIAFDWSKPASNSNIYQAIDEPVIDVDLPPVVRTEEVTPPPPPAPRLADIINIVNNEVEPDDDFVFTSEVNPDDAIDLVKYTEPVGEKDEDAPLVFIAEKMPEFPGGNEALLRYLATSIKYPSIALQNDIQGRVYVSFVVNTKGIVEDVKISRGIDPSLDKEAIRVVQAMPAWTPGQQGIKKVKVAFTVPINFVLEKR